jgi:TRAP-type C4-dicarboxylate transport system permease small subunit
MAAEDIILLVAGVLAPVAVALHVFFGRNWMYPRWAKPAVVILCSLAMVWGCLDLVIVNWKIFNVTQQVYYKLVELRALVGGVCLGVVLSIRLARPRKRTTVDDQSEERAEPHNRATKAPQK